MPRNNGDFQSQAQGPEYFGKEGLAEPGRWHIHALGERAEGENANEPGAQWGKWTALVPVQTLLNYREYDRTTPKQAYPDSESNIESIANDLRTGGPQALKEVLHISYDHDNKWAYLGEGNHRLAAAIRAGVTHLPVMVHRKSDLSHLKEQGVGAPLHLDNRLVEKGRGYFPSVIHPGNFMEFQGAR